jgi:hypothetical protein
MMMMAGAEGCLSTRSPELDDSIGVGDENNYYLEKLRGKVAVE